MKKIFNLPKTEKKTAVERMEEIIEKYDVKCFYIVDKNHTADYVNGKNIKGDIRLFTDGVELAAVNGWGSDPKYVRGTLYVYNRNDNNIVECLEYLLPGTKDEL